MHLVMASTLSSDKMTRKLGEWRKLAHSEKDVKVMA